MSTPFRLRTPDHVPLLGGLITAALVAGWGITQTGAEMTFGRPQSTAALGFVIAPVIGVIFGAAMFALQSLLFYGMRRAGWRPVSSPLPGWSVPALLVIVMAVLVGMFLNGRRTVVAREAARRPRVIQSSPRITVATSALTDRTPAPVLFTLFGPDTPEAPVLWNGHDILATVTDERVVIRTRAGDTLASADLHEYDYSRRVQAAPVCAGADGRAWLAVLVSLRATSQRSMLLVFDENGRVQYQEHLERRIGLDDVLFTGTVAGNPAFGVDENPTKVWACEAAPAR